MARKKKSDSLSREINLQRPEVWYHGDTSFSYRCRICGYSLNPYQTTCRCGAVIDWRKDK